MGGLLESKSRSNAQIVRDKLIMKNKMKRALIAVIITTSLFFIFGVMTMDRKEVKEIQNFQNIENYNLKDGVDPNLKLHAIELGQLAVLEKQVLKQHRQIDFLLFYVVLEYLVISVVLAFMARKNY